MEIERRLFIASLGGAAAVATMGPEAKADAIEDYMLEELGADDTKAPQKFPTVAEIDEQIETRPYRRGAGSLFVAGHGNVERLDPMPSNPTLIDFYKHRFGGVVRHCLQSANHAQKTGMSEEIVFACLLPASVTIRRIRKSTRLIPHFADSAAWRPTQKAFASSKRFTRAASPTVAAAARRRI